jgi:hypothetical protein
LLHDERIVTETVVGALGAGAEAEAFAVGGGWDSIGVGSAELVAVEPGPVEVPDDWGGIRQPHKRSIAVAILFICHPDARPGEQSQ